MVITTKTQKMIIESLFRTIEEIPDKKITVDMVAKRARMTRENIYHNHFRGIPEIIERVHLLIDNEMTPEFEAFASSENPDALKFLNRTLLPKLYENKRWLKILYGTDIDPDWLVFLQEKYTPLVRLYLDNIGKEDTIPNQFLASIVVKEVSSLISVWLTDDNPEPPELFQRKFIHILQQSPADMLTIRKLR